MGYTGARFCTLSVRISIKVTGAQGQGINSVGEMCAKGLKRAGYCVFGYREYMSLIKGGHSSYQLDVSASPVRSSETTVDILVCFNHYGLQKNLADVKDGGVVLHQTAGWIYSPEDEADLQKREITVLCLPVDDVLKKLKAKPILANTFITSVVWAILGQDADSLKALAREQFGHKGAGVVRMNEACIDEGLAFAEAQMLSRRMRLPDPDPAWRDSLLLTGSQALGLGLIHAGCRMYCGYPMTPSSPLLTVVADLQNRTGMVVKQAEDEITAAQMASGAMFMGTRAATGTSGGGFDLMTETLSMNGMIENPMVFLLAQRPGPATGLPTGTLQGDLLLAAHAGHGEFARCVIAVSGSDDCFHLMMRAFNLAEIFQTPVIVLFDKHIAEAIFTQAPYDQSAVDLERGMLVTDPKELRKLRGADRYHVHVREGISPRWLPGSEAATYCAQSDEHREDGSIDETSANAAAQMEKRMKKMAELRRVVPEPELFGAKNPEVLLVSWGSNKGVILDVLESGALGKQKIGYLHYTYLWPLRTEKLQKLASKVKTVVLVECNKQGQLGMLIEQQCGMVIQRHIRKYDGRPFFMDELRSLIASSLS